MWIGPQRYREHRDLKMTCGMLEQILHQLQRRHLAIQHVEDQRYGWRLGKYPRLDVRRYIGVSGKCVDSEPHAAAPAGFIDVVPSFAASVARPGTARVEEGGVSTGASERHPVTVRVHGGGRSEPVRVRSPDDSPSHA